MIFEGLNLALVWPVRLEYFSGLWALGFFAVLAIPIVLLGMRSLNGLGPIRKWVAIGARLAILGAFILLLGGMRWQRTNKDLEVLVLRDISDSTKQVREFPDENLQVSLDNFLMRVSDQTKPVNDRIGVISFHSSSLVDAMPNQKLILDSHAARTYGNGTDVASALQLALATFNKDAIHRLVLIWDGNQTTGDLETALLAAIAQEIPIDVIPLKYDVKTEVLMDRFVAPTWKRENEPFTIEVMLRSTNAGPVTGKLTVSHQDQPMDLDPQTPGVQDTREVTLQPGLNVERIKVPPLQSAGVHKFHASFEAANVTVGVNDTMPENNTGDAFTFVRGRGQTLFVDNYTNDGGSFLASALKAEGIDIRPEDRISTSEFPTSLMQLQNYDAVILANVPRSALSEDQEKMLATYVHDMGGGLLMIGGEDTFGAGGWQGSKLEEILPVNMDIPARRQMPKGALVLVVHSCEFPDGNYWGMQCAIKAIETLSSRDEVGIITFGGAGSQWEYPLSEKGDGAKAIAAAKNMFVGDMPSFEDSMNVALNGSNGQPGLAQSNARQKHVIVISDGDPAQPSMNLIQQYVAAKVSCSTVSVYPHDQSANGLPPTMRYIADQLKGKAYGPINNNFSQLPQIFIKEATVVRRTLILEEPKGIKLNATPSDSDMVKGMTTFPNITGMVLTSRKQNPQIKVPIVAGENNDPVLAHWQTGLGRAAVFTSDARNKWAASWVGSPLFNKFWAQAVRTVSRPPMSSDFDTQVTIDGDRGKIVVEALGKDDAFLNFLTIRGMVLGPDSQGDVRLVQTGPGRYEADFPTTEAGNYVVALQYTGQNGESGLLRSGAALNQSPELRDLTSNEARLRLLAARTKGRFFDKPWDVAGVDLFSRDGVKITASPLPVWDILIPVLLGLILFDVAVRRIAWDWTSTRRLAVAVADRVRGFTVTRKVETTNSIDALKKVRVEQSQSTKPAETGGRGATPPPIVQRPDPKAKFEARPNTAVDGDITQVVGGATDKPLPAAPKKIEPKGAPAGGSIGGLMEAKRRAQQKIEDKKKDERGGGNQT